jgi:hypothetical protein
MVAPSLHTISCSRNQGPRPSTTAVIDRLADTPEPEQALLPAEPYSQPVQQHSSCIGARSIGGVHTQLS